MSPFGPLASRVMILESSHYHVHGFLLSTSPPSELARQFLLSLSFLILLFLHQNPKLCRLGEGMHGSNGVFLSFPCCRYSRVPLEIGDLGVHQSKCLAWELRQPQVDLCFPQFLNFFFMEILSNFNPTALVIDLVIFTFILLYFRNLLNIFYYSFYVFYFILKLLLLRAGDVHPNPGPRSHFLKALYMNIRGLKANLQDVAIASSQYDLVFCSETLVSNYRHSSELLMPGFKKPILLRRNAIPRAQGMCVYIHSTCTASRAKNFECGCHELITIKICSRFNNFYIFALYRNPNVHAC